MGKQCGIPGSYKRSRGPLFTLYRVRFFLLLWLITLTCTIPVVAEPVQSTIPGLPPPVPANLTPAEQAWVQAHPEILVCIDPAYAPIEFRDSNGGYSGLALDFLHRVGESTGLTFKIEPADDWNICIDHIKNKEINVLSAVYISDLRKDYLLFTKPYYKNSLVIVTKTSTPSALTLEQLNGKSVAAVDGYTSHLLLKERYPGIQAIPVPDVKTGLAKVSFGSADAYLGDLATVTSQVETQGFTNLKVSGEYAPPGEGPFQFAFGVRNDQPELVAIMNKGIDTIPPEDSKKIVSRWISLSLTPSPAIDPGLFSWLLVIAVFIGIIIAIILFLNRTLKQQVARKTADLNLELDQRRRAEAALRESEERNTAILAAMPDLLFILSRDGTFLDVRASDVSLLARSPDLLIGSNLRDSGFDPDTTEKILAAIRSTLDFGHLERISYKLAVLSGIRFFDARIIRLDENRVLGIVQDITEHQQTYEALQLARNKMKLLNSVTFQDMNEAVFSLSAYVELLKNTTMDGNVKTYVDKEAAIIKRISDSLVFAQHYQDLGMKPPRWQDVQQVFLYAISHLEVSSISRKGDLEGVEIFADFLLERAFFHLMEFTLHKGTGGTEIILGYAETETGLIVAIEHDCPGIPEDEKLQIFNWSKGDKAGRELFLVQQILSITGISIRENGDPDRGVRFEIVIPRGVYRLVADQIST
jgi:PAS domain S-box-containing protein